MKIRNGCGALSVGILLGLLPGCGEVSAPPGTGSAASTSAAGVDHADEPSSPQDYIDEECIVTPRPVVSLTAMDFTYDYAGKGTGESPFSALFMPEGESGKGLTLTLSLDPKDPKKTVSIELLHGHRYRMTSEWASAAATAKVVVWEVSPTGMNRGGPVLEEASVNLFLIDDIKGADPDGAKIAGLMPHVFATAHKKGDPQFAYIHAGEKEKDEPYLIRLSFKRR